MLRFLLVLRNGEAVDPPAFLTQRAKPAPADTFAAGDRLFRIVDEARRHGVVALVLAGL